jgi:hypothetical protein
MTPDPPSRQPVTLEASPGHDGRWEASAPGGARGPGWLTRLAQAGIVLLAVGSAAVVWLAALALVVVLAPVALLAGWWLWREARRPPRARPGP